MNDLLNALNAIPPGDLSYGDWIKAGMALKAEGYPMSVWDEWSQNDGRYQPGECERKWETFEGTDNPVKADTIIRMAEDYGWASPSDPDSAMDWGDVIGYDADGGDCNDSSSANKTVNELPDPVSLSAYYNNRPPLPQELIKGILRVGHKMLIAGSSKSGKSFLLMQLCVAIAKGLTWLGFQCRKGKVLYINFEIDKDSCINRFFMIYDKLGIHDDRMENIDVWNLRGYAVPLDKLVPKLLDKIKDKHYDAIILDPIYKVITGDENSASAMGEFCNQIDIICNKTGASVIYCHHHSKGAQGAKRAMDRASGSGVFARDPDALLDIIRLELSDDIKNFITDDDATAWRMQSSLREFPNITPVNFWFKCPIHEVDDEGILDKSPVEGSTEAGKQNNHCSKSANEAETEFNNAFDALNFDGYVDVDDMAAYIGVIDKTIYSRLKKLRSEYRLDNKKIYRIAHD